jgi:hypothetical protein
LILLAAQCRPWPTTSAERLQQPVATTLALFPFLTTQVYANFDQDRLPDVARVSSNGDFKSIRVTFGNAQTSNLCFKAPTATLGSLFAEDIDRDRDTDLIWVPHHQFGMAVIWLGNGQGQFELAGNPERYQTELARLYGGEKNSELGLDTACPLLAVCSTQYQYAAAVDNHHCYFPSTALIRGADSPICHAFAPSISYLRKRGPPPRAV